MLHATLIVFLLVAISLSFAGANRVVAAPVTAGRSAAEPRGSAVAPVLSRNEIRERLAGLATSNPPGKLSMGAMCYKPAGPPGRVEYACPECGEKTLYTLDRSKDGGFRTIWFLHRDLANCRRMVSQIRGLTVSLDEREFCAKCEPHSEQPKLVLLVRHADARTVNRVSGVSLNDLTLIREFVTGETKHIGSQGRETPLNKHVVRLEELLGVKGERKEEKN